MKKPRNQKTKKPKGRTPLTEATTPHPPGVGIEEAPHSELDDDFKKTMAIAEDFMKRYRNALWELAKGPAD